MKEKIIQEIEGQLVSYLGQLLMDIFIGGGELRATLSPDEPWPTALSALSPVRHQVELLVAYASGETTDEDGEVQETIQSLMELLFCPPGTHSYAIPDQFWGSDLGMVVRQCQVRSRGDDLITYSEAATIITGANTQAARMTIQRLVSSGELSRFEDLSEPNPQRRGRVSRAEVEALNEKS